MKNFIILMFSIFMFSTEVFGQAPQAFNYQGVARNGSGAIYPNQSISLKMSILQNDTIGPVMYSEIHNVVTSSLGLFTIKIGKGLVQSGIFNAILWSGGTYYLLIEMDLAGGTNYVRMGTPTQLISVPYALEANHATTANGIIPNLPLGGDASGPHNANKVVGLQGRMVSSSQPSSGQVLKWNAIDNTWEPGTDNMGGGGTGDNWGNQVALTNSTIAGDGTANNRLSISQQGATNGQVLKWNGTSWVPATDNTGGGVGDNWGNQVVQTQSSLSGNGLPSNPMTLAPQGAVNGQVLKWNGLSWTPGNDLGGTGITIPYLNTFGLGQTLIDITNTAGKGIQVESSNNYGLHAKSGNSAACFLESSSGPALLTALDDHVGIGVLNPDVAMDVNSTSSNVADFNSPSNTTIRIYENNEYRGYIGSVSGQNEDYDLGTSNVNLNGKLHLTTKAIPRLTILPEGSVGIGNLIPDVNTLLTVGTNFSTKSAILARANASGNVISGYNAGNGAGVFGTSDQGPGGYFAASQLSVNATALQTNGKMDFYLNTMNNDDIDITFQGGTLSTVKGLKIRSERGILDPIFEPEEFEFGFVGTLGKPFKAVYSNSLFLNNVANIFAYSDQKLKENIKPLNGSMHRLTQLNPVLYDLKKEFFYKGRMDKNESDRLDQSGLIAQEVELVYPKLVNTNEEGIKSVSYMGLIPDLIGAIKEKDQQIISMKKEMDQLKARVSILENMQEAIVKLQQDVDQLQNKTTASINKK